MLPVALIAPFLPLPVLQFESPVEITRRFEQPSALCFGDFDGDGLGDVVGSSRATGHLRLWRGDGAGSFDVGIVLPVALSSITGMSAGDLDGDGDLDLAAATIGPSVVWIENLGGGAFAGEMPLAGFGAPAPGSIVRQRIVDLDGNGTNDVLMTFDRTSSGQESLVLLASSMGAGQFQFQTLIMSPTALFDADAADLDGDGHKDIVVGGSDVGAWYRNDGAGAFVGPIALPLFSGATDEQVGVRDVDGDGDLDLLSIQCFSPLAGAAVYVSAGDGTGAFTQQSPVALTWCAPSIVFEDVNGDGRADLLAAGGAGIVGGIELALGAASGAFDLPAFLVTGERPFTAVGLGDADGDGVLEVALGTEGGEVLVRELLPAVMPPALEDVGAELTETVAFTYRGRLVDTADFNGDGWEDVCVLAAAEGKIAWWPADGSGGFGPLETIERFQEVPRNVYVGDVDGDGAEDVMRRDFATGEYWWNRGDGAGSFAAPALLAIPFFAFPADGLVDVDGDGLLDLVYAPEWSQPPLAWAKNLGGGVFGPRTLVATITEPSFGARFQDVTGDGLADLALVVQASGGAPPKFAFFAATAPGVFAATRTDLDLFAPFVFEDTSAWNAADMDGDGAIDLVVSVNAASPPARNRLMLYRGLGNGQFGPVSVFAGATQNAEGLELSDLDGDGRLDIVHLLPLVPGQEDGLVWYRNVTGTQFAPRQSLVSSAALFSEFLLGDFDGDGDVDAVFSEHLNDAIVRIETLYRGDIGAPYCAASVANSTGQIGALSAFGSALPGAGDLTLTGTGLPLQSFGMFIASQTTDATFTMNSVGVLCLGGAIGRFNGPGQIVSSGATGSISLDAMPSALPTPQGQVAALAGQTWHFQAWHRDTVGGQATSNFTRAVSVRFL